MEASPIRTSSSGVKSHCIHLVKGHLSECVDDAERALIEAEAGVYLRGSMLVRVASQPSTPSATKVRRQEGAPIIVPFTPVAMADALNRVATFKKYTAEGQERNADCPTEVAETLLSRVGMWRFPPLVAVIDAPTLRPDGTIIAKPGYDDQTGILFKSSRTWPSIAERPTRQEAIAALGKLKQLVASYPFVGEADRSAALAMLLTATIRPGLPTAPMFAITAPTPGTGKSHLADLASVLATGRRAVVVGASCDEDELEKRLGACLMAGDRVLNLDNLDRPLKSERLCQVLTQEAVKFRILGRSNNIDTPTTALMIATGNALRVHGDLTRRVLLISLDAREERPEAREFRSDPVATAISRRAEYVVAALVVMRAFIGSKAPSASPSLGSFELWSERVRSALVWLGMADPLKTMDAARETDPERERTSAVLAALRLQGDWTVKDLSGRIEPLPGGVPNADLLDALAGFIDRGKFNRLGFGNWCAKHLDRPVDGMRLVHAGFDARAKVKRWQVEDC